MVLQYFHLEARRDRFISPIMEDSWRTLQESFPVQAFKQQQSHAGWGLFHPQCYSTSTG